VKERGRTLEENFGRERGEKFVRVLGRERLIGCRGERERERGYQRYARVYYLQRGARKATEREGSILLTSQLPRNSYNTLQLL
jgi:hypothetical protein